MAVAATVLAVDKKKGTDQGMNWIEGLDVKEGGR